MGKGTKQVALVAGGQGSDAIAELQGLFQLTKRNKQMWVGLSMKNAENTHLFLGT